MCESVRNCKNTKHLTFFQRSMWSAIRDANHTDTARNTRYLGIKRERVGAPGERLEEQPGWTERTWKQQRRYRKNYVSPKLHVIVKGRNMWSPRDDEHKQESLVFHQTGQNAATPSSCHTFFFQAGRNWHKIGTTQPSARACSESRILCWYSSTFLFDNYLKKVPPDSLPCPTLTK